MPYEIPEKAGMPYRPSNGGEGYMFMEQFCDRCIHDRGEKECELIVLSMVHNIGEPGYPEEWTHDFAGRPQCTAFVAAE